MRESRTLWRDSSDHPSTRYNKDDDPRNLAGQAGLSAPRVLQSQRMGQRVRSEHPHRGLTKAVTRRGDQPAGRVFAPGLGAGDVGRISRDAHRPPDMSRDEVGVDVPGTRRHAAGRGRDAERRIVAEFGEVDAMNGLIRFHRVAIVTGRAAMR